MGRPMDNSGVLSNFNREPGAAIARSISKAERRQNGFTVPYLPGLDLIFLLLYDYFQYRYRNEAPASPCFLVFQLAKNKIRPCSEYTDGSTSGIKAV